jgi:hypothetical protein
MVRRIRIEAIAKSAGSFKVGNEEVEISAQRAQGHKSYFDKCYDDPRIVNPERPLPWMDKFKILQEALRDSDGGSIEYIDKVDAAFGMSISFAKKSRH